MNGDGCHVNPIAVDRSAAAEVVGAHDYVERCRVSRLHAMRGSQNRASRHENAGAELALIRIIRQRVIENQCHHAGNRVPDVASIGCVRLCSCRQ